MTSFTLQSPPIGSLPGTPSTPVDRSRDPVALGAFVRRTRPWGRHQGELSVAVTCALWALLVGAGAVGGWLVAVRTGAAPCSGPVCSLATLGRPTLLLTLAAVCVGTLLVLVPFTRGLTKAGAPEIAAMVEKEHPQIAAVLAGIGSLLGVVAVAVLTVAIAFVGVAGLLAVVERG